MRRGLLAALAPLDAQLSGASAERIVALAGAWAATARDALDPSAPPSDHHLLPEEGCAPLGRRNAAGPSWQSAILAVLAVLAVLACEVVVGEVAVVLTMVM